MYMEEVMINQLKNVCGYDFTSKLHRMFNDIRLSTDLNSKFSEHLVSKKDSLHINFNVNVLQVSASSAVCGLLALYEIWFFFLGWSVASWFHSDSPLPARGIN